MQEFTHRASGKVSMMGMEESHGEQIYNTTTFSQLFTKSCILVLRQFSLKVGRNQKHEGYL